MISLDTLRETSVRWQTSLQNVVREYVQNLFLSHLYQLPGTDRLFFKGGTALRILHNSPRFSEDLDFSANIKPFHLKDLLEEAIQRTNREGVSLVTRESKPTSGGYLALYAGDLYQEPVGLELNISLRAKAQGEPFLVSNVLVPPWQCMGLRAEDLAAEKADALLTRGKPRDYFDIYFLLRSRIGIDAIQARRKRVLSALKSVNSRDLVKDLKPFLPISHQRILRSLPSLLASELG